MSDHDYETVHALETKTASDPFDQTWGIFRDSDGLPVAFFYGHDYADPATTPEERCKARVVCINTRTGTVGGPP